MSTNETHELAERLARGEEAAFAELYDACADRLHHYVASRLGSREGAADVVQNAFLRAVKSRRRFRGVENPVAYMFQIARNETARAAKRGGPRGNQVHPADELFATSDGIAEQRDDADAIAAALQRLGADDRELIELKIFSGLTFREIAELTALPQGTVATRYRRALESLRPWLVKQLG
jgi:RNA polymerase sigma-70 factor (ECF subfamily)